MSKLREKFGNVILGKDHNSECEKITEEFTCGFGNWLLQNHSNMKIYVKAGVDESYMRLPMKSILEIYKKEKNL